jgi:hypothetical protein
VAFGISALASGTDNTDAQSWTTGSFTPVAGRLYLIAVNAYDGSGAGFTKGAFSGNGMTWAGIGAQGFTAQWLMAAWAIADGSSSAGGVTVDVSALGHNIGGITYRIYEITGVSGVVQDLAFSTTCRTTGDSLTLDALGTLRSNPNAVVCLWGAYDNAGGALTLTAETNWTKIGEVTGTVDGDTLLVAATYRTDTTDTTGNASVSAANDRFMGQAIEFAVIQYVAANQLSTAPTLHSPTVTTPQTIAANHLAVGPTLHTPEIAHAVDVEHLIDAPTIHDPSILGAQIIAASHLAATPTIHEPVSRHRIASHEVAAAPTVYTPKVVRSVAVNHLSVPPTLHSPAVARRVAANTVDASPAVHLPAVSQRITAQHLSVAATVLTPGIARQIAAATLTAAATVHNPALVYVVTFAHLAATATLHEPTITTPAFPTQFAAFREQTTGRHREHALATPHHEQTTGRAREHTQHDQHREQTTSRSREAG